MKKILALFIIFVLIFSLCACAVQTGETAQQPVTQTTTTAPTTPAINIDGIDDVLMSIKTLPLGTAGSSLKCALVSVEVLEWTSSHDADPQAITQAVLTFFSRLDILEREDFKSNFESVDSFSRMVIDGSEDAKNLLSDSGAVIDFSIDASKYEVFSAAVNSVIGG